MAATLTAALRNPAGDWVFVTTNDGASGWTPVAGLVAFGLDQLPVLDVSGETAAPPVPRARRNRDGHRDGACNGN